MPPSDQLSVAIARCRRYHSQEARDALKQVLEPYGGIEALVKPGQRVLLKPNLLAAARPAEAVTTHPLILQVMTELVHEAGGKVFIGDSPAVVSQEKVLYTCGIQRVIENTGAEALSFSDASYKQVRGFRQWRIPLAAALDQIDVIINLAKLKTHSFTGLTAAVKNLFGCVPGGAKAGFHFEHPLPRDFAYLLLDVYYAVNPDFSIIDAVIAMEGTGPRRGKPRQVGLLMASPNALALDNIAASVLGFRPEEVATLAAALELNLEGSDLSSITVKGVQPEACRVAGFDKGTASYGIINWLASQFPLRWIRAFRDRRRPYPHINSTLCNGCGICYEHCPAQAINFEGFVPDIDPEACIRCYCCNEFCPRGAVDLSGPRALFPRGRP